MKTILNGSLNKSADEKELVINIHSKDKYWLQKVENSNRFQSEIQKAKKILKRFVNRSHPSEEIKIDLFIEPKKHFKQYKFNCKMHILGIGNKDFSVENYSENYLESITKSIKQSISFLNHQSSFNQ